MYTNHNIYELVNNDKELIFIHTPKCAGSYVRTILNYLNLKIKGHEKCKQGEGITFTVVRNPIDRFESLLNYRLGEKNPRLDWPETLKYAYKNKHITLNEIVSKMTNKEILGFSPYKTLKYWTKDVDIIITIEELPTMLEYFGYTYDKNLFQKINVSKKTRGKLNNQNRNRIQNIYRDDMNIYNKVINSILSKLNLKDSTTPTPSSNSSEQ